MHGNKEFLILFIPVLLVAITVVYFVFFSNINFAVKVLLGIIGIVSILIDAFALLVQFVNWKYYKEWNYGWLFIL